MSITTRWAAALRQAGTPEQVVSSWQALRSAIAHHQKLLAENGIGKEVSERDRVRVNARRVGLEAPLFADEAEATFADVMKDAFDRRAAAKRESESDEEVAVKA